MASNVAHGAIQEREFPEVVVLFGELAVLGGCGQSVRCEVKTPIAKIGHQEQARNAHIADGGDDDTGCQAMQWFSPPPSSHGNAV